MCENNEEHIKNIKENITPLQKNMRMLMPLAPVFNIKMERKYQKEGYEKIMHKITIPYGEYDEVKVQTAQDNINRAIQQWQITTRKYMKGGKQEIIINSTNELLHQVLMAWHAEYRHTAVSYTHLPSPRD